MVVLPGRGPLLWLLAAAMVAQAPRPTRVTASAAFPPPRPEKPRQDDTFSMSRLEPYFATGALAQAKSAFDSGLYPRALAALDRARPEVAAHPELGPPVRYLRALALLRAGLPEEAARDLIALETVYPAIADPCRFSAAVAFEGSGHPREAAAEYALVSAASPLRDEALLGESRALAAAGRPREALAALEPLRGLPAPASGAGRDFGAEALLAASALERRLGQGANAVRDEVAIWLRHPLYRAADAARTEAARAAAGLGKVVAKLVAATDADLVARAARILEAHRLDSARAAFAPLAKRLPLGKAPSELACRVHFGLGKALRMLRHHEAAIAELRPVADRCRAPGDGELRARALYVLGSSASIVRPDLGVEVYAALADDFPSSPLADDALFYEADLDQKAGRTADARAALAHLVERYPAGDFANEALFRLFWLAREAGKPQDGLWALEKIEERLSGERVLGKLEPLLRARYWHAATLAAEADPAARADGEARLAALAREVPFSYYGALALGRLPAGADGPPPPPPAEPATVVLHAGTLLSDPDFRAGVELLRLGFPDAAAAELAAVDRRRIGGPAGRAEPLLLLAICLDRAGNRQLAHSIAKATLELPPGGQTTPRQRLLWEAAYPLAYRPEIQHWSAAAEVPSDLVQALMREESALDPAVISGAGAVGLTQLMPSTAARLARRLGLARPSIAALGVPDVNIRLGAAYVGELWRRYGGSAALVLAAYNAGEGAVDRWLAARGKEPLDAFVEEIPIAETRGYVKRVLGTWATYRFLYGQGADRLSRLGVRLSSN